MIVIVLIRASLNVLSVNFLYITDKINAPAAPNAAASVGAAHPNIIEPNTENIINKGGTKALKVINIF